MTLDARTFVAGHGGLVGSGLMRLLQARGATSILTATRDQLDLRDQAAVNYWFRANRPEYAVPRRRNRGRYHGELDPSRRVHLRQHAHSCDGRARRARVSCEEAPLSRELVHLPPQLRAADGRGRSADRRPRTDQ